MPRSATARWVAGGLAVAFGVATVVSGGRVLLGVPAAREAAGRVVLFVLVFNTAAGVAYVLAGVATLAGRRWAIPLARLLAVATLVVFAALGVHVLAGGDAEVRTGVAMVFRSAFWVAEALLLPRLLERPSAPPA